MARVRLRFKRRPIAEVEGPGEASLTFPRLNWTQAQVATVRTNLDSDAAYRTRWETHWNEFRAGSGTKWTAAPVTDPYALAYAAHVVYLRTDGDHGISWGETRESTLQKIRDGIASATIQGALNHPPVRIGLAHIYDNLYNEFTQSERDALIPTLTECANQEQWKSAKNMWDDQLSDQHISKALCGMVLDDFEARKLTIYDESVTKWAMSNNWMAYATGIGYEWKDAYPCQIGLMNLLLNIRNCYGYTTGETLDTMLTHLRDVALLVRMFTIPHASMAFRSTKNYGDHVHQQAPDDYNPITLNVGGHMLWAMAVLPGKVDLSNGQSQSGQAALAASEDDFLGYLEYEWTRLVPGSATRSLRSVVSGNGVQDQGATTTRGGRASFFSFPAWLVLNAAEPLEVDPTTAAIPKIRRYGKGTQEWTIARSTLEQGQIDVTDTMFSYHHRRWSASGYENGTKTNGAWHLHRGGPLLGQRGNASHGPVSRFETTAGNGCPSFEDGEYNLNEWPVMKLVNQSLYDNGGARIVPESRGWREVIEAETWADYGQVVRWSAEDDVYLGIGSDLTRNFNSTLVQSGDPTKNQPKVSSFVRELVMIPRGSDATDRTKVFTFDRITQVAAFIPVYNVCPMPPQITIDGSESALTWPGTSDPALNGSEFAPPFNWTATGPNHWEYTGGSYIEVHNNTEPTDSTPGTGKARVTCLEPSGANLKITKRGGTNMTSTSNALANGQPFYQPTGANVGVDDRWNQISGLDVRAYTGLFTCSFKSMGGGLTHHFLVAAEDMPYGEAATVPTTLTTDAGSKGVRCGPSAAVFGLTDTPRTSASVTVPVGITRIVIANLIPNAIYTVTAGGSHAITSPGRTVSTGGHLPLTLDGAGGTLTFSQGVASALSHDIGIGAVTDDAARAWFRTDGAASVSIKISPNADLSAAVTFGPVAVDSSTDFCGQIAITGLTASTTYYREFVVDGVAHYGSGFPAFDTFPTEDAAASFTLALGSCMRTPNEATIFQAIKNENPLLFLHLGDYHYGDSTVLNTILTAYKNMYAGDWQSQIVTQMSTAGMVSDHDAGGNNVAGNLVDKANYVTAFDRWRPHYDFAFPGRGVTQQFKCGHVHVVAMDCRYNREHSKPEFPETGGVGATDITQSGTTTTAIVSSAHADLKAFDDFYNGWYVKVTVAGTPYYRRVVDTVDLGSTVRFVLNSAVPGLGAGATYRLKRASMLDKDNVGITEWLIDLLNTTTSTFKLVLFDVPFNPTNTTVGADPWGGFDPDFMELNYLLQHITAANVDIGTGDRHKSGIDDGTGSGTGRVEITASPLNDVNFSLGGSWSHGTYGLGHSYGTISYTPTARTFRIKDATGGLAAGTEELLVDAA